MDLNGFFLPFAIGLASVFAAALFFATVITHETRKPSDDPRKKR